MVATAAIANYIRDGKTFQIESAMQVGGKHGMVLMNDALLRHVEAGLVDVEEAMQKSLKRKDLLDKMKAKEIDTSGLVVEEN